MKIYKLFWEKSPVKNHKFYILLFALCFCNTAFGQKQQITVSMKNQPLLKLFESIEAQSDLSIAYNQSKLDVKNILVLQNAFEKTRKQMKVNALSINTLSDNLNFPMFAKLTLKKT